jgi:hypothetical protein
MNYHHLLGMEQVWKCDGVDCAVAEVRILAHPPRRVRDVDVELPAQVPMI